MKTFLAATLAVAFTLSAVPAFACGGDHADKSSDDTVVTSTEKDDAKDSKKDAKKSAKKENKKENEA